MMFSLASTCKLFNYAFQVCTNNMIENGAVGERNECCCCCGCLGCICVAFVNRVMLYIIMV